MERHQAARSGTEIAADMAYLAADSNADGADNRRIGQGRPSRPRSAYFSHTDIDASVAAGTVGDRVCRASPTAAALGGGGGCGSPSLQTEQPRTQKRVAQSDDRGTRMLLPYLLGGWLPGKMMPLHAHLPDEVSVSNTTAESPSYAPFPTSS